MNVRGLHEQNRNKPKTSLASRINTIHDLIRQGIEGEAESRTNDINKAHRAVVAAHKNTPVPELIRQHGGTTRASRRRILVRINQLRTILPYCTDREEDKVFAIISLLKEIRRRVK